MKTVSQSGDLRTGHMIDVPVRNLPQKLCQDWEKHKQQKKIGVMASEDIFGEFIKSLKEK